MNRFIGGIKRKRVASEIAIFDLLVRFTMFRF